MKKTTRFSPFASNSSTGAVRTRIALTLALGVVAVAPFVAAHDVSAAKPPTVSPDPPSVSSLQPLVDGFHWGQNHADVIKQHVQPGGVIDKDYDPALMKVQPGVAQKAIEADRDNHKTAFASSYIEFGDTPTGYDTTEIHGEYTYKNKEALLYIERAGKRRYFFFIGDRLWKIFDEVTLKADGPLGPTFADANNKMNNAMGVMGRVHNLDPDNGYEAPTVEWQDATSHLRLLDLGRTAAVVVEERATLQNLPQLRSSQLTDPMALDPSIAAVTHGTLSDPNAASPAPSASAKPPKKGTKPKPH